MNRDRFEGGMKQLGGVVEEQWGKLTGNPLRVDSGKRAQLFGKLQERHGTSKEDAERQLKDFLARNRDWDLPSR
jgi:uncharacterized protein YjbJ (UPF0337 family)